MSDRGLHAQRMTVKPEEGTVRKSSIRVESQLAKPLVSVTQPVPFSSWNPSGQTAKTTPQEP